MNICRTRCRCFCIFMRTPAFSTIIISANKPPATCFILTRETHLILSYKNCRKKNILVFIHYISINSLHPLESMMRFYSSVFDAKELCLQKHVPLATMLILVQPLVLPEQLRKGFVEWAGTPRTLVPYKIISQRVPSVIGTHVIVPRSLYVADLASKLASML